ncbi:MAG: mechanosensitive ion channel family protein [Planctomycetes bacterium]|nr:mechanosensitive ion channel family protein [Planctomycetota bacterium]
MKFLSAGSWLVWVLAETDSWESGAQKLYEAAREYAPESLQGQFFGIEYWQYLAAFLCMLLGFVARKVADFVFEHYIIPTARKTRFKFDHLVAEAIYKPFGVALLLVGVFGSLTLVGLQVATPEVRRLAVQLLKVAFAADLLWFLFRAVDVLAHYLETLAARTDSTLDDQLVPLIKKSLKAFVGVLMFITILQTMGYSVSSLLAGLGIGGLAVAMAAKDTLANLFAGIVIFTDRPFRVGDWVKVGDVEGTVEQIGFRSTRIRTFPKTLVTLPNSLVVDSVVDNKAAMPIRRVRMTVGVTYETTAEQMEDLVGDFKAILAAEEKIDHETSLVRFIEFGASSLDILVMYFTQPIPYDLHSEVVERINLALMRAVKARGLSIAFPTQTVYFEGDVAKAMAGRGGAGTKPSA